MACAQVHGSEDSLDLDVVYVVPVMPAVRDCHAFCADDPDENRNLVVLRDGVVVDCFKVGMAPTCAVSTRLTLEHMHG